EDVYLFVCIFFFSSRRRHTRFSRDWSSDVCSSDLDKPSTGRFRGQGNWRPVHGDVGWRPVAGLLVEGRGEGGGRAHGRRAAAKRSEERRVGKECRTRWCA